MQFTSVHAGQVQVLLLALVDNTDGRTAFSRAPELEDNLLKVNRCRFLIRRLVIEPITDFGVIMDWEMEIGRLVLIFPCPRIIELSRDFATSQFWSTCGFKIENLCCIGICLSCIDCFVDTCLL
jgi:hypothetical protein